MLHTKLCDLLGIEFPVIQRARVLGFQGPRVRVSGPLLRRYSA